jgi:hypothetical protein
VEEPKYRMLDEGREHDQRKEEEEHKDQRKEDEEKR